MGCRFVGVVRRRALLGNLWVRGRLESVARTRNCEVIAPVTMGDGFEADQLMMGGGAIRDGLAEMAQLGFVVCPLVLGS